MGKDLTRISMPVYLNEPISMLQRSSEMFEHRIALEHANNEPDRFKRLAHCVGFFLMNMAQIDGRSKKPFNPLLGETFEVVRDDLRVVYEQVSHHPPISAFYSEDAHYVCWGSLEPKSKFTFTKMLATPIFNSIVELKKTKERFYLPRLPTASVHNIIRGDLYVWYSGDFEVINLTTGDRAKVSLKSHPLFGSLDYSISGTISDAEGSGRANARQETTDTVGELEPRFILRRADTGKRTDHFANPQIARIRIHVQYLSVVHRKQSPYQGAAAEHLSF